MKNMDQEPTMKIPWTGSKFADGLCASQAGELRIPRQIKRGICFGEGRLHMNRVR